jgi:hypothetical protein
VTNLSISAGVKSYSFSLPLLNDIKSIALFPVIVDGSDAAIGVAEASLEFPLSPFAFTAITT